MSILDRFRRQKEDMLPEEVEKYYQSQRRARVGTAWLLGFLTLVITLVVALGLYYGVRYAYRQITDSNDTAEITTDEDQADSIPEGANQTEDKSDKKTSGSRNGSEQEQTTSRPNNAPRTGDQLPANGDQLPATGDPGL
jgi:cytoskeletal protein RodZ